MEAAARWLDAALPALSLDPSRPEVDEPRLTAAAEFALLLSLSAGCGRRIGAWANQRLKPWLERQARHPSLQMIVNDGPALALTAPLALRVHLGDAAEPHLPAATLLAAAEAQGLRSQAMTSWRRVETETLLARLAGTSPPLFDAALSPLGLSQATVGDLYRLTHEIFHLTGFGARPHDAPPHAADLAEGGLAIALAAGHEDLTAEFIAARRCAGRSGGRLETRAWRRLAEAAMEDREILAGYHVRLTTLVAALTPVTSLSE